MSHIGEVIAQLRHERGLSQADLAYAIGRHQSYIALLEAGKRTNPSDQVIFRLAKALGVPYKDFCRMIGRVPAQWPDLEPYLAEVNPHRIALVRDILLLTDEEIEAVHTIVRRLNTVHDKQDEDGPGNKDKQP